MNFVHNDLGWLNAGQVVEVTLGNAANVRLMDQSNFNSYRQGQQHRFYGGHAVRSPIRLQVPNGGHWHVAIDLGGNGGTIRSSVRVYN